MQKGKKNYVSEYNSSSLAMTAGDCGLDYIVPFLSLFLLDRHLSAHQYLGATDLGIVSTTK